MIFEAKNFASRVELENEVRNRFGLTPDVKPEHTLRGTRAELVRLQLSDMSIFWGIKCEITDEPTVVKKQEDVVKVNRGARTPFGIGNNLITPP